MSDFQVFEIWNGRYRRCVAVADSKDAAVAACVKVGFIRKPSAYRKIRISTDAMIADDPTGTLAAILAEEQPAVVECDAEGQWAIKK